MSMKKVAKEGAKGVRNRSADSGKSAENAKKMLFRGNEPKNTLKTKHLTFPGTQNELLFESTNPRSNPKNRAKDRVSGVRGSIRIQEPGFGAEETDFESVRAAQQGQQTPWFSLDNVSFPTGKKETR
jgi:hypothetical protein